MSEVWFRGERAGWVPRNARTIRQWLVGGLTFEFRCTPAGILEAVVGCLQLRAAPEEPGESSRAVGAARPGVLGAQAVFLRVVASNSSPGHLNITAEIFRGQRLIRKPLHDNGPLSGLKTLVGNGRSQDAPRASCGDVVRTAVGGQNLRGRAFV